MIIIDDDGVMHKVLPIDTLDKIKDAIEREEKWLSIAGYTAYNVDIAFDAIKAVLAEMR